MSKNSQSKIISKDAQQVQDEIFRKMTPERRLHLAGEFYDFAKNIVASEGGERVYERIRKAARKGNSSA